MSKRTLLKDRLFNPAKVEQIAHEIAAVQPGFRAGRFVADVLGRFPELELKARIGWMAECLERHLPGGYRAEPKRSWRRCRQPTTRRGRTGTSATSSMPPTLSTWRGAAAPPLT